MEKDPEGVHVGSGSFRVDRGRALEMLMRFQLPDADLYVVPWIRCAVASKATVIRVAPSLGSVDVCFDGRPFSKDELRDPYAGLFAEEESAPRRNRDLAVGILTALRLDPLTVTVISGAGPERFALTVESLEKERLGPCEEPGAETILRVVRRGSGAPLWTAKQTEFLRRSCGVCPVPLWIGSHQIDRERRPAGAPGVYFEEGSVFGWLTVPHQVGPLSTFDAHCLGVRVGRIQAAMPRIQCIGYLNDDQFTLNASHSAVVEDAAFKRALGRAALQAERLMLDMIRQQGPVLTETGRSLLEPENLAHWKAWLQQGPEAGTLPRARIGRRAEILERLRWSARVTAWLRDASIRLLKGSLADSTSSALAALWEAPILLGADCAPLSLKGLEEQRRKLGYVPVSREPAPGVPLPFKVVWLTSAKDIDAVSPRFPGCVRDVTDRLATFKGAAVFQEGQAPGLDWTGAAEMLVRAPLESAGRFVGEIGLSLLPHANCARLHAFKPGEAARLFEVASALRFDASLARDPASVEDWPGVARALEGPAGGLYRKLSRDYDCWRTTERNVAAREHLLDYLAWSHGPGREREDWIETTQLFECVSSWLSLRQLQSELAAGHPIYLAPGREFAEALKGKLAIFGWRRMDFFLASLLPEAEFASVPSLPGVRVVGKRGAG